MTATRHVPRWPLFLIAAPAAVAIWSGWVGLGAMCGFGLVEPLPGIVAWHLNTAITLPVGIEAYGAYALGAWLTPAAVPARAQTFARRSAIGALVLGMTGQVIFHLLAAAHAHRAPWPVVVLVACLPVVTLGFGAALTHLLRAPGEHPESAPGERTWPAPASAPGSASAAALAPAFGAHPGSARGARGERTPTRTRTAPGKRSQAAPVTAEDAEREFAAVLASGAVPSIREIRSALHVGQDRGRQIHDHLASLTTASQ